MRNKLAKRLFSMALSGLLAFNMVPVGPLAPLTAWADDENPLNAQKTLKDNKDGTYTLALDVTSASEKVYKKVNVVIVTDHSGSMRYYSELPLGRLGSNTTTENTGPDFENHYKHNVTLYSYNGSTYSEITQDGYTGTVYQKDGSSYKEYTGKRYKYIKLL